MALHPLKYWENQNRLGKKAVWWNVNFRNNILRSWAYNMKAFLSLLQLRQDVYTVTFKECLWIIDFVHHKFSAYKWNYQSFSYKVWKLESLRQCLSFEDPVLSGQDDTCLCSFLTNLFEPSEEWRRLKSLHSLWLGSGTSPELWRLTLFKICSAYLRDIYYLLGFQFWSLWTMWFFLAFW